MATKLIIDKLRFYIPDYQIVMVHSFGLFNVEKKSSHEISKMIDKSPEEIESMKNSILTDAIGRAELSSLPCLSKKTVRLLEKKGIEKVDQLIQYDEDELISMIPGFGKVSMKSLKDYINYYGERYSFGFGKVRKDHSKILSKEIRRISKNQKLIYWLELSGVYFVHQIVGMKPFQLRSIGRDIADRWGRDTYYISKTSLLDEFNEMLSPYDLQVGMALDKNYPVHKKGCITNKNIALLGKDIKEIGLSDDILEELNAPLIHRIRGEDFYTHNSSISTVRELICTSQAFLLVVKKMDLKDVREIRNTLFKHNLSFDMGEHLKLFEESKIKQEEVTSG